MTCDNEKPSLRNRLISWVFPLISILSLFVFAFVLRAVNWSRIFDGDRVFFLEGDCFYHMRRVLLAAGNSFAVPDHDLFMNFPSGLHCNWPPLFDQIIAFTGWLLAGGNPSVHFMETVGAITPAVMGAVSVVAVCILASVVFRRRLADPLSLLAGVILALLPYHIQISVVGRTDHHVAVALFSILLILGAMLQAGTTDMRRRLALAAVTGFFLFLLLDTWTGSTLFVLIMAAAYLISLFALRADPASLRLISAGGAVTFLSAAVFLWPSASGTYWGKTGTIQWDGLGPIHIVILLMCAGAIFGCRLLLSFAAANRKAGIFVSVALTAAAIAFLFSSPLIAGGFDFLFKKDPVLRNIYESGPATIGSLTQNFSALALLFPVIALPVFKRLHRDNRTEAGIILILWLGGTGLCAVVQERFADVASAPAAIMIAATLWLTAGWTSGRANTQRAMALSAAIAVVVISMWPPLNWIRGYIPNARHYSPAAAYEIPDWLRENTPAQPSFADMNGRPDYSVLCTWELGNMLTYVSRRANVANGFVGWSENRSLSTLPYRFLTTDSMDEAEAIVRDCRARYIVISEPLASGQFAIMISVLGLNHADFFSKSGSNFTPLPRARSSMAMQLYLCEAPGFGPFKLVYESKQLRTTVNGKDAPQYRIFEYDQKNRPTSR